MEWTVFEYLYRDANNHKAYGQVVLEGVVTDAQWEAVLRVFDEDIYFVAEQIGLPPLYDALFQWGVDSPTDADHCWHEFVSISVFAESQLPCTAMRMGRAKDLLKRIHNVSDWNLLLSPNAGARRFTSR